MSDLKNLPEGWFEETLVDKLDSLIDYRGKTPKKSEGGVLTLSAKSVKMGNVDYSQAYFISEETYKAFMVRGFPKKGDVLMTTEAPLGCIAKLDRDDVGLAQRLLTLRGKEGELDNDFLRYYLTSRRGQHELQSRASGSTVQGIKRTEFEKVQILMPKISEQKDIAKVLSCLDDKISLLQDQNKTLETMSQTIFKEWFGKYTLEDELPVGWCVGTVGDVSEMNKRQLSINDKFKTIKYIDTGSLTKGEVSEIKELDRANAPSRAKRKVKKNSILYSVVRPLQCHYGILKDVEDNYIVSTGFCVIESEHYAHYLYLLLTQKINIDYFENIASSSASTYPTMRSDDIANFTIIIPSNVDVSEFEILIDDFWKKITSNNKQIQSLTQTRDTLLPKLMSGEVRV